jgi:hypothetical protein
VVGNTLRFPSDNNNTRYQSLGACVTENLRPYGGIFHRLFLTLIIFKMSAKNCSKWPQCRQIGESIKIYINRKKSSYSINGNNNLCPPGRLSAAKAKASSNRSCPVYNFVLGSIAPLVCVCVCVAESQARVENKPLACTWQLRL